MIRPEPTLWVIGDRRLLAVGTAWAAASATAILATVVISPFSGVAVVAVAAIFAVIALGERPVLCLAVVLGLVPALVAATPAALVWILAGSLIASAIGLEGRRTAVRMDDLRRHISAARRRNEQADVVVFTPPDSGLSEYTALLGRFRLTDSAATKRVGDSWEVEVALDHAGLDRAGVERRISTQLGRWPRFGWA